MRSIQADFLAQLQSGFLTQFSLLEFTDGASTYRFNDSDMPFYYDDELYIPYSYRIDNIQYSLQNVVDEARITITNLNSIMTAAFANGSLQDESLSIYNVVLDVNGNIIDTLRIFTGFIDNYDLNESEINIMAASYFARWSNKSVNKHGVFCRWKVFGGTECGYSGTEFTSCNRTWSNCEARGNKANYGGFPTMASAEDKYIWWGPTPSERKKEG
jgi:hypothetical protein